MRDIHLRHAALWRTRASLLMAVFASSRQRHGGGSRELEQQMIWPGGDWSDSDGKMLLYVLAVSQAVFLRRWRWIENKIRNGATAAKRGEACWPEA